MELWEYYHNNKLLTESERFHVCNNLDNEAVIYEADEKISARHEKD